MAARVGAQAERCRDAVREPGEPLRRRSNGSSGRAAGRLFHAKSSPPAAPTIRRAGGSGSVSRLASAAK